MDKIEVAIILLLLIVLIFFGYEYITNKETLIATDERATTYGNIVPEKDIDTMLQRKYIPLPKEIDKKNIDNSDVIERAIEGYITQHTPNGIGVSDSTSATLTKRYLKEPEEQFVREPYQARAYDADEASARRQQHRGDIEKKAIDGSVRSTKNRFAKYFREELDQNEGRVWWSAESKKYDTDFDLL